MSDSAPIVSRMPGSGRSPWRLAAAAAAGIATSITIGVVTALAAYYPMGGMLPRTPILSLAGTLLGIIVVAGLAVAIGIRYSLVARSWRPFFLSIIVFGTMIIGVYPAAYAHGYLRWEAFHLLAQRSKPLTIAIKDYERDAGVLPQSLAELVPKYLPEIPGTRMSAYPHYEYSIGSGFCKKDNTWNITVLVGEILNFDTFFYCPRGDYPSDVGGNPVEIMEDWAYMWE